MEINLIWIILAAFLGGMATALIGWSQQGGSFNGKKFGASLARSLIGGVVIAIAIDYSGATVPLIYLIAFCSGAGIEVGGNRIMGASTARR